MSNAYRYLNSDDPELKDESGESSIGEGYQMLKGPDGFECCITEPEDRTFSRDLAPIVRKLNEQHQEIQRLKALIPA